MTKVWWKYINRYWRYCGNFSLGRTDVLTDGQAEARTEACKTCSLKTYEPFGTDISEGGWFGAAWVAFFDASAATTDCLEQQTIIALSSTSSYTVCKIYSKKPKPLTANW